MHKNRLITLRRSEFGPQKCKNGAHRIDVAIVRIDPIMSILIYIIEGFEENNNVI